MASMVKARVFFENLSNDICSPFFDSSGFLHFIMQDSSNIMMINQANQVEVLYSTNGQPSSGNFDKNGLLYVSDFGHGSVIVIQEGSSDHETVVDVYEDKPIKGPSGVVSDASGNIYFTDSGPFGETGLQSPTGSLFMITNTTTGQILRPLALETLAYPAGLALSPNGKLIYVAEQMTNRILRFTQKPEGAYHASVFYQISGGIGPNSIACDKKGNLYVGIFDTLDSSQEGRVLVISPTGELISTITVNGPEVSGVAINGNYIYITERSTKTVYRSELVDRK